MLMVAYGESQSDRLQLHHPEVCYTAQGFRVSRTSPFKLDYSPSAPPLKVTRLVAQREERIEPISYWMRIGYDNSNSNWARQALKLGYGLRGWVPDGALFRVSTIGIPAEQSFKIQDKFIRDLLNAVDPADAGIHGRRPQKGAALISVRRGWAWRAGVRPRPELSASLVDNLTVSRARRLRRAVDSQPTRRRA